MEFCNGIVSLCHTKRHATTAAFRSTPGTVILKTAHIVLCEVLSLFTTLRTVFLLLQVEGPLYPRGAVEFLFFWSLATANARQRDILFLLES